jgi:hypothetical protein
MLLQMNGIGKQKITYKDHTNITFDNLDDYLILAKKAISKFSHPMSKKMLKDEDAISLVANAIMMADWRWDENYQSKQGTKKTKYSYRNQCAIWAIQTYLSKEYQKNKKYDKIYSLDYVSESEDSIAHNLVEDKKNLTPYEIAIKNELYFLESETFENIGKKYGITREAVRQGLNKAILTIRSHISEFSI